jgi:NodT family efflux transporter outer membrane factor (OMF) lipoprotein
MVKMKTGLGGQAARWVLLAAAVTLPSACSLTPDYERPKQDIQNGWRNPAPDPSPELPRPTSEWWKAFGSDEINAIVEEALSNNHDVKAATQRISQAEAQAGSALAALLPTITATGRRTVDSPSGGQGTILSIGTNRTHRLSSAGLSTSYEFDLWGKVSASADSSLATALANVHDRETIAITMVSDLVTTYLQYLQALDRETVARDNVANMKTMHAAVRERVRLGESSEVELAQQRNVLAQGEASLPPLVLLRERAFNKIAVLMGRSPGRLTLNGKSLKELKLPEVSPGLPSDLLLRRPDIKKAEANLIAANANIGVARAKMLPSFSMTGERGWASQLFDNITSPGSIYYQLAGSLAATIFDNGKNQADVDYSRAKFAELTEVYQQSVLAALRDVEDSLADIRLGGELEVAQREVLLASQDAHRLSSEAFRLGMVDYLNVLETQRTRFQAEDTNVQARYGRLAAVIGLYKALGGGMERPESAVATPAPQGAAPAPVPAAAPSPTPAPAAPAPSVEPPPPAAAPVPPVQQGASLKAPQAAKPVAPAEVKAEVKVAVPAPVAPPVPAPSQVTSDAIFLSEPVAKPAAPRPTPTPGSYLELMAD